MSGDTTISLQPHEVALLLGGPRHAVTVAVVALYLRGSVEAGRPGTIRASRVVAADAGASVPPLPPLADAVLASLHEPAGPRQLVKAPDVRVAVAEMRVPLAEAGLLRYPFLGPTRAARRHVRSLRARQPLPASRHGLTEYDKLLAVALHGEAALVALMPRFALRAGLTRRAEVAGKGGLIRHSPRSGSSGSGGYSCAGGYSCGGGGGGSY